MAAFADPDVAAAPESATESFTLRLRRYDPESGSTAYWEEHTVELEPHRSVLEGILQAKAKLDGSIGIRCSCRAAICGSCGVRINGQPGLACHTHLDRARASAPGGDGVIVVEPMGNMPVIKDLIVDMDAVHWKKIQRVTPWLINSEPIPEREYVVDRESMVDVTQTMACIQCGACVSDCLSMEVDPEFVGPAALAKAYRFVGDPRDAQQFERLKDLAEDPAGIYDCTHCFKCIDACPKDVAPMSQIMRLRRRAGSDHQIDDRNNGHRHESAFVTLVRQGGLLHEAELLPRSYGGDSWFGKFAPAAGLELLSSLPVITKALLRRKVTPGAALKPHQIPKADREAVGRIYDEVYGHERRVELNLYITGVDEEQPPPVAEQPPAEAPVEQPPAEAPVEEPPAVAEEPPAEAPVEEPPAVAEEPPAEAPAEQPPAVAEEPPAEAPAEQPPAVAEEPPAEAPAEQPPAVAEEPPAEAPAEQPPAVAEEPPAEAPAEQPPAVAEEPDPGASGTESEEPPTR